ncbi:MAG: C13 family peptidase [Polyangiaceae bacterium]
MRSVAAIRGAVCASPRGRAPHRVSSSRRTLALEARALVWAGDFEAARALLARPLDVKVAGDDVIHLERAIVAVMVDLYSERIEEARAAFDALNRREEVHAPFADDVEAIEIFLRYFASERESVRKRIAPLLTGARHPKPTERVLHLCLAAMARERGDASLERDELAFAIEGGGDLFPAVWGRSERAARFGSSADESAAPQRARRVWRVLTFILVALACMGVGALLARRSAVDPFDADLPELRTLSRARQAALLDDVSLLVGREAKLLPQRQGVRDMYLLAVAGYASQDVFQREVESVVTLFDERYGTRGRSVILSNRGPYPHASAVGISHAIRAIGARMDPAEDIFILYATSPGSASGLFLEFGPRAPYESESFSPSDLATALDEAAIRHRVLIVAGCQTGVFVDALRNDDTLLLTAAAPDRFSYGCANGRAFTDFGRTLVEDALPRSVGFEAAFRAVIDETARRESKAHQKPSLPQLWVGAGAAKLLAAPQP